MSAPVDVLAADGNGVDLEVIVGGQPINVLASDALSVVVRNVLVESGNTGQPPERWEMRSAAGVPLDLALTATGNGLVPGSRVFLNLKAGWAGAAQPVDVLAVMERYTTEIERMMRARSRGATGGGDVWWATELREASAAVAETVADLRSVSQEMRARKVNHGKSESPTLIAWANRIDAALARIGVPT